MPSTGETKLAQMRAYYRTPKGQAASAKKYDTKLAKLGKTRKPVKAKPAPLVQALANWR